MLGRHFVTWRARRHQSTRPSVNADMTRGRFGCMRCPILVGACVAIVLAVVGCRPRIPQTSLPVAHALDGHFPEPDPESWDANNPAGLQPASCQLTDEQNENVLLSFLHGIALATELEPI